MTPELTLVFAAIFASVALGVWAIGSLVLNWGTVEQRQIRKLAQGRSDVLADLQLTDVPSPWVKRFQQAVPKSPKEMSALRRRLTAAGYRSSVVTVVYALAEILLPILFGGGALLYFGFSKWYVAIFAAALGFV